MRRETPWGRCVGQAQGLDNYPATVNSALLITSQSKRQLISLNFGLVFPDLVLLTCLGAAKLLWKGERFPISQDRNRKKITDPLVDVGFPLTFSCSSSSCFSVHILIFPSSSIPQAQFPEPCQPVGQCWLCTPHPQESVRLCPVPTSAGA